MATNAPAALRETLRRSLAPASEVREPATGRRPAAVVVPLVGGPDPTIVFTKRTDHLSRHPGEISFPGGMRHDEDPDLLTTALRETHEELGVAPTLIEILGTLPPLETFTTGFTIVPFVGALAADPAFTANPEEIAEVLEFTVSRLLDAERPRSWDKNGRTWWGYAWELDGHTIWGATGRILHELLELIRGETP